MTERYQIQVTLDGDDRLSPSLRNANNQLEQFDNNQKRAASNSRGLVSGLNDLHGAVDAFMGAAVIQQSFQFAQGLYEDGEAARRANITFREMAGGVEEANRALADMRAETGNAVNDVALMQGANQLLVTGLADSTDQAGDFVDMAIRLSTAMGVDAADGIENFNSALLNMSYARLDTLGIASSRVRERVAELVEVGYETEEAFQMAVLEEGAVTLDRLGAAASLNEGAFSRLQTASENARNELGLLLNQAVETGSQLVIMADIIAGGSGLGTISAEDQAIRERSRELFEPGMYLNPGVEGRLVDRTIAFANTNPDLFQSVSSGVALRNGSLDDATLNDITTQLGYSNATDRELRLLDNAIVAVANAMDEASQASEELAESNGKVADSQEEVETRSSRTSTTVNEQIGVIRSLVSAQEAAIASSGDLFQELEDGVSTLSSFAGANSFDLGGVSVFDPNDLATVQAYADELQADYEELARLAEESDYEFITRDDVSLARELAGEAANIASEAERGAEAFANLSLDQLLGETGGGQLGELFDQVLGAIQNEDVASEAGSTFDLASGRATDLSTTFENEVVPTLAAITEQFGADVAAELSSLALTQLQQGQAAGLSDQTIIDNVFDAIGYRLEGSGPADRYTVSPGEGVYSVAANTGYSPDDVYQAIGGQGVVLQPGQIIELGAGQQLVAINQVSDAVSLSNDGIDQSYIGGAETAGLSGDDPMSMAADKAFEIETAFTNMSALDLDPVIDPILADAQLASTEVDALDAGLQQLTEASYTLEVDMRILMNDLTGLQLSQSFAFQEGVRMVMESNGIRFEDVGT